MLALRPTRNLESSRNSVDSFFNEALSRFFEDSNQNISAQTWTPAVDIYESNEELNFTAEFPGFEKDQIDISVEDGRLTISGERQRDEEESNRNYHRSERFYGRLFRSFHLPNTADVENISANLQNGLLTVTVPKREEAKARQIKVQS